MKSIICVVLVVLVVASTISAAVIMAGKFYNPANELKCTISDTLQVKHGRTPDTRPGVECGLILCYNDYSVELLSCSTKEIFTPGFKYDGYADLNREYPECCELKIVPINPVTHST